jgi:WD40 repeat protein
VEIAMRAVLGVAVLAVLIGASPVLAQDLKPDIRANLLGHRGGVTSLAFDPQGHYLATGAGNGIVRVWDVESGQLLAKIDDYRHNGAAINRVAFSADGRLLSAASKSIVGVWSVTDPKKISFRYEDGYLAEPGKTGVISGSGKRVYFTSTDGGGATLRSYTLATHALSENELPAKFKPWAVAAIPDLESGLIAVYGQQTGTDKSEPALALVGIGDPKVIGQGEVKPRLDDRPVSISFSPDSKWLVLCNGVDVQYWPIPGSHVISGSPRTIANVPAFAAAVGPRNLLAVAAPPEPGQTVTVTLFDLSSTEAKPLATYATSIRRISTLAFSPNGQTLAVSDDVEGVVQLWTLGKK